MSERSASDSWDQPSENNTKRLKDTLGLTVLCSLVLLCALIAGYLILIPNHRNRNRSQSDHSKPVYRVIEKVYHQGWRTCGEIDVYPDGYYAWTVHNLWKTPPSSLVFRGRLPIAFHDELCNSFQKSELFQVIEGVPTHAYGIDDNMSRKPDGLVELVSFLYQQHAPVGGTEAQP
jgi:hypothetical protein